MLNDPYEISSGVPSVKDYRRLRTESGLSDKSEAAAAAGLPNTWYGVLVRYEGRAVGMGRVIGDGGTAFQVVDVCVLPAHQGKGLGKVIMESLTAELERRAPAGAYVSLIADGPARFLYERYGFADVSGHGSVGMYWAKSVG